MNWNRAKAGVSAWLIGDRIAWRAVAWFALIFVAIGGQAAAPRLSIEVDTNAGFLFRWSGRGKLEAATSPGGPWWPLHDALASPFHLSSVSDTRYYRLNLTVDASTLHKKVICGYQGWFQCPGDGGGQWEHWSRDWSRPPSTNALQDLTFEMWPDVSEYSRTYPVPGFSHPDGRSAALFSSMDQSTVDKHFDWMLEYGIDGIAFQRFVTQLPPNNVQSWKSNVLAHVRAAANRTGRVFCLEYDMSGANPRTLFSQLTNDWVELVTCQKLVEDPRYLHHDGRPVLLIFGLYPERFQDNAALPQRVIDWFKTNSVCPVTLIGSGMWNWRTAAAGEWAKLYRSFHGYCPWNTGNRAAEGTNQYAATAYWEQDLAAVSAAGMFYLPQIYPGFGWDNLQKLPDGASKISRLGGRFLWRQFHEVAKLGLDCAFVGMFDEVDEGTAVFKVSNNPPAPGRFQTYEGLPSDWYLRLTAEGTKVLAGERPNTRDMPIVPALTEP
jgi:hypothetical protein